MATAASPSPADVPEPDGAIDDAVDGPPSPSAAMRWRRTFVDDRPAVYGVAGAGPPVVFLHGWGLGHHAYKAVVRRIAEMGVQVFAPALPGFGGTAELPRRSFSIKGYAAWLAGFLDSVGVDEPAVVIGHSFGGGVGIRFAVDHSDRLRSLVLVNSIGGSAWQSRRGVKKMAERPLWDWGLHFPSDILPIPQLTRVLPVVLEDALPNVLRNPRAVWRVAQLARQADLRPELELLKEREVPVTVLWGTDDRIVPKESFDALCAAIGADGEVVAGNHSWLLADPDQFGEVITNVVEVAKVARELEADESPPPRRRGLLGLQRSRPRTVTDLRSGRVRDEA